MQGLRRAKKKTRGRTGSLNIYEAAHVASVTAESLEHRFPRWGGGKFAFPSHPAMRMAVLMVEIQYLPPILLLITGRRMLFLSSHS